jgi:ParB family chromosome partitioning protein
MRLLKLPAQIQMALKDKAIDMGHARALLALDSPTLQIKLFKDIQKNNYSVRKVEEIVQLLKSGHNPLSVKQVVTGKSTLSKDQEELKKRLSDLFQTKVQVSCSLRGKGKISIPFRNEEELERITTLLSQMKA